MLLGLAAQGQQRPAIVAVQDGSRKVFENTDGPAAGQAQSSISSAAASQAGPSAGGAQAEQTKLVYWSSVEHRWKPAPGRNAPQVQQAQSAADDVWHQLKLGPSSAAKSGTSYPAAALARAADYAGSRGVSSGELDRMIEEAAARHNVDANLVRSVIKVESNFNPNAVSRKGAIGLMQLMPQTARGLNVTNPFDPEQNVDAGVRHLKTLLDNFSGDVPRSLAAYNAGERAVLRSGGVPPYSETRNYVQRITHLYNGGGATLRADGRSAGGAAPVRITKQPGGGAATFTNVY